MVDDGIDEGHRLGPVPSLAIAYGVYVAFLAVVELYASPQIAAALIQGPDLAAGLTG